MVLRAASREEIAETTLAAFGESVKIDAELERGEAYALKTEHGPALFVKSDVHEYKITIVFTGSGVENKLEAISVVDWMFENTDAERVIGYISSDNKACLALIKYLKSYTLDDGPDGLKIYRVVKSSWLGG